MKSLVQKLLWLSLAVAIALPLAAQDKEKKKKAGNTGPVAQLKKALSELDLKEEQQAKIDEIIAKFAPKIAEAAKAAGAGPRKLAEAKKSISAEGKKGKELAAAVKEAANLSADEQAGVDKLAGLNTELRAAVAAVLTDEQKEKAGFNKGKKKKKDA